MKKTILIVSILLFITTTTYAFCGFYVAKAGASLFNNRSEVILVRDGQHTTITMSNDFKGDIKDFAMVIPVPSLLQREDIRIVERTIFTTLDNYSSPRLAEYYDPEPCYVPRPTLYRYQLDEIAEASMEMEAKAESAERNRVKIEAIYHVEEYEVIILSAEESNGLKNWLTENGYAIPKNAEDVLEPYIKNKLKFFVVKVDLNKYNPQAHDGYLRPLQIKVKSDRFMLPIRLGMANSSGEQDMVVYAFTKEGRIESTNYRTVEIPTNKEVPTFVANQFGTFYKELFQRQYEREHKNAVFLEYAWNVTPSWSGVKCDPCVGTPPYFADLERAGVTWANDRSLPVFFTRLHVRYSRDKFPEDLFFQITPNKAHKQARFVIRHPAQNLNCDKARPYLKQLRKRRANELLQMEALTGWDADQYAQYIYTGKGERVENNQGSLAPGLLRGNTRSVPKALLYMSSFFLMVYIGLQIKRH